MKRVFVTVGPRGTGKSTFCEQVVRDNPNIVLVSRDKVMLEVLGRIHFAAYSTEHLVIGERLEEMTADLLASEEDVMVILDCWNSFPSSRIRITEKLREQGADWIEAWRFVTSEDTCVEWFLEREKPRDNFDSRRKASSCRHDYRMYHSHPVEVDQGFDAIRNIDPLQESFLPFVLP